MRIIYIIINHETIEYELNHKLWNEKLSITKNYKSCQDKNYEKIFNESVDSDIINILRQDINRIGSSKIFYIKMMIKKLSIKKPIKKVRIMFFINNSNNKMIYMTINQII